MWHEIDFVWLLFLVLFLRANVVLFNHIWKIKITAPIYGDKKESVKAKDEQKNACKFMLHTYKRANNQNNTNEWKTATVKNFKRITVVRCLETYNSMEIDLTK